MPQTSTTTPLGRDLGVVYASGDGRHENVDLRTQPREVRRERVEDLVAEAGVDNAVQAVIHRIKTVRGEMAELGHPDYGSRHHELVGMPNSENNRNLVKLYVLQALGHEPRIEKVHRLEIVPDARGGGDTVTIDLVLSFIGSPVPANLVVPFGFGGPA